MRPCAGHTAQLTRPGGMQMCDIVCPWECGLQAQRKNHSPGMEKGQLPSSCLRASARKSAALSWMLRSFGSPALTSPATSPPFVAVPAVPAPPPPCFFAASSMASFRACFCAAAVICVTAGGFRPAAGGMTAADASSLLWLACVACKQAIVISTGSGEGRLLYCVPHRPGVAWGTGVSGPSPRCPASPSLHPLPAAADNVAMHPTRTLSGPLPTAPSPLPAVAQHPSPSQPGPRPGLPSNPTTPPPYRLWLGRLQRNLLHRAVERAHQTGGREGGQGGEEGGHAPAAPRGGPTLRSPASSGRSCHRFDLLRCSCGRLALPLAALHDSRCTE